MAYSSSTIGAIVDKVNRTHFLPAIQRPFVWSSDQVIALFDSLLKGYPISSFMFWAVDEETKSEVRYYKFLEHFRPDARNEVTTVYGHSIFLVLDGQQRLASLLIGLRGSFSIKAKGARNANAAAWSAKNLYIDLLKDPDGSDADDDSDLGITYGFAFHDRRPPNNARHHWFKVGSILDYESQDRLEGLVASVRSELHEKAGSIERQLAENNLRQLHNVIWQEEAINIYTETDQSADRVLDIFVRANDGGTKLSKADLLMSMITSKWSAGSAREDILGFIDYVNKDIGAPNRITMDFVLKASLIACDYNPHFKVKSFSNETINEIEKNWTNIKRAIENTFRLVNRHGLFGDNLGSINAVLPIIYYMYNTPDFDFRGSTEFERANAAEIHYWLLNSLLVVAFSGQSDRTITAAIAAIKEHLRIARQRSFPKQKLFDAMARNGRISEIDERSIDEILDLGYGSHRAFAALSLLYHGIDWSGSTWHVDHIIPQADAQKNVLRGRNIPEYRVDEMLRSVNRLGNLQLLRSDENIEKGALPFKSWITGRRRDFCDQHMIPDRLDLCDIMQLPEFVQEREKLICKRLLELLGK